MKELEWPMPMATPPDKKNQGQYYHFHKDHGHDTEEYLQLKEEIERFLKQGLLGKYVKDNRGKQKVKDCPPPRAGVINMIAGKIAVGRDSTSTRKSYARSLGNCFIERKVRFSQNITFGEEDLAGVAHPHDDALVIVGDIADFDVKMVLVDGGSPTNVLIWDAFLGLMIFSNRLKIVTTPLQGFRGATVISERTVELPVTLSTYPIAVIIVASFLVIKISMAYNEIYNRPLLNVARAIPSTYHRVMKFSTTRGVGCLTHNLDVFAWSPNDIIGINPAIAQHRFGVLLRAKPVK
ncbi:uncharacterized protein LOC111394141 [Olea europaea var. sylvestris]|uniref:uncharacterized protein LOC111394141 n=1 Tax=Olea europaea var. sylvestris TaxID=158386 RepID=UPI000C1D0A1A|nr:uncharacterized protein LOC111394141 [Olea europaea var. sylvestris]